MSQSYINTLYKKYHLNKREIDLVLCHALQINTAGLLIYDKNIIEIEQQRIENMLDMRLAGKPLAYITGTKAFWTLDLHVNEHTLIPRPETELLVELLLQWTDEAFSGTLLDLGTGSGAIALSFAQQRPQSQVTAVDFSQECIDVAKRNHNKYQLKNVEMMQSNWFSIFKNDHFDLIVSNPPYIDESDEHLAALKHEPITALTAKKNGLADLYHIIEEAPKHLNKAGRILLEHGYNQHQEVQKHLEKCGYHNIKSHKDLANINRVTSAEHPQPL